MSEFVHLRVHSEYSVEDSLLTIPTIVEYAKNNNMSAIALTDLNNLFAFIKFYDCCIANSIKPIIGVDLSLCSTHYKYRIIILVKNLSGFVIINQLITTLYKENFYFDDTLCLQEKHVFSLQSYDDLIILSGGIFSDLMYLIEHNKQELAVQCAQKWKSYFADNYYIELNRVNCYVSLDDILPVLVNIAAENKIAVVATHPVEFVRSEDFEAHEVRMCIAKGIQLHNVNEYSNFSDDFYFVSPEEMELRFADLPVAINNVSQIVKRCNLSFSFGEYHLPDFHLDTSVSVNNYLCHQAEEGIFSKGLQQQVYQDRLKFELDTIINMGFAGYFLIVADFVNWAKQNEIPVGPGRGSGAGSLVAYSIGITDLDPIKYGLLFERFLNPERVSMPDFDIDFCQDKREDVIRYVNKKYGINAVSQIITFGTLSSKAVIKDVGRVLSIPYQICDTISKLILNTPVKSYSLEEAYNHFPELKTRIDDSGDDIKRLWQLSLKLENLVRNVGKHAAGVLIAPSDLMNYCPLYVIDNTYISQLDKDDIEHIGLVKFDFLGLRNLTVIQKTLQLIKENHNCDVLFDNNDLHDDATYKLLQSGNTLGVFQLESTGMKKILVKLSPDRFEDIVALLALYRPGPLGSGMVDSFINRKHGTETVDFLHDDLYSCLETTYGVIVYQEQVMEIARIIAGYTLGESDILRRAMGKKKPKEMKKHRSIFLQGALKKGYTQELAEKLFTLMELFAGYGFNKSHSTAYAVISYQTAYLKCHYCTEFISATLSSELSNTDKIREFYDDCIKNNIKLLPPDINHSEYYFKPTLQNEIIYALGAIKGIGKLLVDEIVNERWANGNFTSLEDFCLRCVCKNSIFSRKVLESLILSGVFDSFNNNRCLLYNNIDIILSYKPHNSLFTNQLTLNNEYDDFLLRDKLFNEKKYFGYFF